MNQESLARIDGFLLASAEELFGFHGVAIEARPEGKGEVEEPFTSSIGFTSDSMKGALVLTVARSLARASLPANLRDSGREDDFLADWVGELSNQMLGRLKNRFTASGLQIALSTPIVFVGREMRHFFRPSPIKRVLEFSGQGGMVAEFLASYERDFEVSEAGADADRSPPEGEVLFF